MADKVTVPKYVAGEDSKISGFAMQAFQKSISADQIMPTFERVMKDYGYESTDIDMAGWYPLQMYFDICKDLLDTSGDALILVSIGMKVIESAQFPPEINSIATGMTLLKDTHHLNLQNVPEHDGYHSLKIEDKQVTFVEQTAFPHDVMYGYIYGLSKRYAEEGTVPIVEREYLNDDDPDSDGAHYTVSW
ncbi:MAG: hypothetical protein AAF787_21270 [Chloroflexota bacterium]